MRVYYTVWSTWKVEAVKTPWEFWIMSTTDKLKPRKNSGKYDIISKEQVAQAFENLNSQMLDNIEKNYVEGYKIASFVYADSESSAITEIKKIFEDAEFEKIAEIDENTKSKIILLFEQTIKKGEE
jgi:hypothetical protein